MRLPKISHKQQLLLAILLLVLLFTQFKMDNSAYSVVGGIRSAPLGSTRPIGSALTRLSPIEPVVLNLDPVVIAVDVAKESLWTGVVEVRSSLVSAYFDGEKMINRAFVFFRLKI